MPIIIFRVAYMPHYRGEMEMENGGSFPEKEKDAGERWNFRVENGQCYGYVMSQNFAGIDLNHIDPEIKWEEGDLLEGVNVVFIARKPNIGQVVVGWYRNATVFHKTYRERENNAHEDERSNISYLCQVVANNAILLPEEERTFSVPYAPVHGRGFIGMSHVWYPDTNIPDVEQFINNLNEYINEQQVIGRELQDQPVIGRNLPLKDEADIDSLQTAKTITNKRLHNELTNRLKNYFNNSWSRDFSLLEGCNDNAMYDVLIENYDENNNDLLIEVKSSSESAHIRMAIGQVFDYWFRTKGDIDAHLAILTPNEPNEEIKRLLEWLEIGILWFDENELQTCTDWLSVIIDN